MALRRTMLSTYVLRLHLPWYPERARVGRQHVCERVLNDVLSVLLETGESTFDGGSELGAQVREVLPDLGLAAMARQGHGLGAIGYPESVCQHHEWSE